MKCRGQVKEGTLLITESIRTWLAETKMIPMETER